MVSALDSGESALVVFLGKALYCRDASLRPGVYMGTGEFTARG